MLRVATLRGLPSRVMACLFGTMPAAADTFSSESGRFTDGRARASWPEADLSDPETPDLRVD